MPFGCCTHCHPQHCSLRVGNPPSNTNSHHCHKGCSKKQLLACVSPLPAFLTRTSHQCSCQPRTDVGEEGPGGAARHCGHKAPSWWRCTYSGLPKKGATSSQSGVPSSVSQQPTTCCHSPCCFPWAGLWAGSLFRSSIRLLEVQGSAGSPVPCPLVRCGVGQWWQGCGHCSHCRTVGEAAQQPWAWDLNSLLWGCHCVHTNWGGEPKLLLNHHGRHGLTGHRTHLSFNQCSRDSYSRQFGFPKAFQMIFFYNWAVRI